MQQQSDKTMISQNRVSYHNGQKILSATYTSKFAKKKVYKTETKKQKQTKQIPLLKTRNFLILISFQILLSKINSF